ncbi:hypothetical protein [uncultured Mucilaginibacter sp.]|uniref:hypothetical protein n=1 Tax=uncultured Mucilaginibacter sp. TaxID=797541 RepID=UPI0025F55AF7|nr:hypothetical protein [uncultured Mucilaginibacter sp.]
MNKLFSIVTCMVGLLACNEPAKTNANTGIQENKAVRDHNNDHGCVVSEGLTWSELQQDCIKVYNEGFRLNPVASKKNSAVISAFVLWSKDKNKVELFLPDAADHKTIILNKSNENTYQDDQYKFDSYKSVLYVNGIEKYKGNVE